MIQIKPVFHYSKIIRLTYSIGMQYFDDKSKMNHFHKN